MRTRLTIDRRTSLRIHDDAERYQRPRFRADQPDRSHRDPRRALRGPDYNNLSPRVGVAWDVTGDGRTAVRGGYGVYYDTNSSQNLIVTVTNPPATPRVVFPTRPSPMPPFDRTSGFSIRPVQWDVETPPIHVWNVNVQRELWGGTRDAGLCRLARPTPVAE